MTSWRVITAIAIAFAAPAHAQVPDGDGTVAPPPKTPQEQAEAARARAQALYDLDHADHEALAAKRHVGHVELLVGALITAAGAGLFAVKPNGQTVALSGGLVFGGVCTLIVGGITTVRGADPNPVVPPPPPLVGGTGRVRAVGWAWRF